jgi:hypothetical protein
MPAYSHKYFAMDSFERLEPELPEDRHPSPPTPCTPVTIQLDLARHPGSIPACAPCKAPCPLRA